MVVKSVSCEVPHCTSGFCFLLVPLVLHLPPGPLPVYCQSCTPGDEASFSGAGEVWLEKCFRPNLTFIATFI